MNIKNSLATAGALLFVAALSCSAANADETSAPAAQSPKLPVTPYSADEATAARVRNLLAADSLVGSASLTVKVANGVVELGGTPKDPQARDLAIRIAQRTHGVTHVVNKMAAN